MDYGNFTWFCQRSPIPLCSIIKTSSPVDGVLPQCYARTVTIANTLVFELGTAFINMSLIVILLLIIYLVRLRYTAVARREMLFFYSFAIIATLVSLIVDTGVVPPGSAKVYNWFVSVQIGCAAVCCWSLLFAGVSGFGLWEDGSTRSMVALVITSALYFALNFVVAALTLNSKNTLFLWTLYFVVNPLLLVLWLASQLFVCLVMIAVNWWALGALFLSVFFFAASQVLLYGFSQEICEGLNHYADGSVFAALSLLFSLMMVFKYWDIITFDDDEYYRWTQVVRGIGTKKEAQAMLH